MVMRTPPQSGMRPAESRLKAMAVPITSCMSEPMMATSIVSHSSTRGTLG